MQNVSIYSGLVVISRDTYALDERVNCVVVVPGILTIQSLDSRKRKTEVNCRMRSDPARSVFRGLRELGRALASDSGVRSGHVLGDGGSVSEGIRDAMRRRRESSSNAGQVGELRRWKRRSID